MTQVCNHVILKYTFYKLVFWLTSLKTSIGPLVHFFFPWICKRYHSVNSLTKMSAVNTLSTFVARGIAANPLHLAKC